MLKRYERIQFSSRDEVDLYNRLKLLGEAFANLASLNHLISNTDQHRTISRSLKDFFVFTFLIVEATIPDNDSIFTLLRQNRKEKIIRLTGTPSPTAKLVDWKDARSSQIKFYDNMKNGSWQSGKTGHKSQLCRYQTRMSTERRNMTGISKSIRDSKI